MNALAKQKQNNIDQANFIHNISKNLLAIMFIENIRVIQVIPQAVKSRNNKISVGRKSK